MYIPRIIDKNLAEWARSKNRRPLVLHGARQVGKSATVDFLGETFSSNICVNFESRPELLKVFEDDLDPKNILKQLEVIYSERIIPGETLIFFDEIQECL